MTAAELAQLAHDIKLWARELGFDQVGITDTDLALEEPRLQAWLDAGGYYGIDISESLIEAGWREEIAAVRFPITPEPDEIL